MDRRWTRAGRLRRGRCAVSGCERPPTIEVEITVGGEIVRSAWCGPHAAEYRVDEVTG